MAQRISDEYINHWATVLQLLSLSSQHSDSVDLCEIGHTRVKYPLQDHRGVFYHLPNSGVSAFPHADSPR